MFPFGCPGSNLRRQQVAALLVNLATGKLDAGDIDGRSWEDLADHGLFVDQRLRTPVAPQLLRHSPSGRPGERRYRK
ncbi:hypothetical protein [Azospirillum endophyticum]